MDICFGFDQPQAVLPPFWIKMENPIDKFHPAAGQFKRFGKLDSIKKVTKAFCKVSISKYIQSFIVIAFNINRDKTFPVPTL